MFSCFTIADTNVTFNPNLPMYATNFASLVMSATTAVETVDTCEWIVRHSSGSSNPVIYLNSCKAPIVDIYANYSCTPEGGNRITTHVYFKPLQGNFTAQLKCGFASSSVLNVTVQGKF